MATVSDERLTQLIDGYSTWANTNSMRPQIDRDTAAALTELQSLRSQAGVSEADVAMTPEEHRLEDLKQMARYSGPIVSFEAREPYYLASCDKCGWVCSSEACGTDSGGDDSDVYCPRCHASGADCGKVAASIFARPNPIEITDEMVERLAKFITEECYGYSWDGLRQDGRVTDRGFKTFRYDSFGGKAIQGTQNDLRDVARNAFAALQGETK